MLVDGEEARDPDNDRPSQPIPSRPERIVPAYTASAPAPPDLHRGKAPGRWQAYDVAYDRWIASTFPDLVGLMDRRGKRSLASACLKGADVVSRPRTVEQATRRLVDLLPDLQDAWDRQYGTQQELGRNGTGLRPAPPPLPDASPSVSERIHADDSSDRASARLGAEAAS